MIEGSQVRLNPDQFYNSLMTIAVRLEHPAADLIMGSGVVR